MLQLVAQMDGFLTTWVTSRGLTNLVKLCTTLPYPRTNGILHGQLTRKIGAWLLTVSRCGRNAECQSTNWQTCKFLNTRMIISL